MRPDLTPAGLLPGVTGTVPGLSAVRRTLPWLWLLSWALLALGALPARAYDTAARAAYVIDQGTGTVLFAKNADEALPPASMSKLMTLTLLFEKLAEGEKLQGTARLTLDSTMSVSEKAWRMEGSKMFLEVGRQVRVEDLIHGIIVQSGNDACVVVAEALAGSEEAFAARMTARAQELGLTRTRFANSTGWPDPNEHMSARDLVLLADHMIRTFPQYYHYFGEDEFTFNGIRQRNRNPLLTLGIGADGLKTGHTSEAGYGLVGSAVQDGRRIVFVLMGLPSMKAREEEAGRIANWALREFQNRRIVQKGQALAEAEIWLGAEATVPLVAAEDISATLPAGSSDVKLSVIYKGPVEAPVAEGQEIARLVITSPGLAPVERPLVAGRAVEAGGYLTKVLAVAGSLVDRVTGSE